MTADKLAAISAVWFVTYAETIWRSPHADTTAELLIGSVRGLESSVDDPADHLKALARIMVAGLSRRLPSDPAFAAADMRRRQRLTGQVFVSDGRAVPVSFAVTAPPGVRGEVTRRPGLYR